MFNSTLAVLLCAFEKYTRSSRRAQTSAKAGYLPYIQVQCIFFIHCILTSYSLFHSDISSFGLHLSLKLSVLRRCRSNRLGAGRGPKINLGKLGPAPWDRSMAGTPETRACSPCIITPNFVALGKPFESNYGNLP